MSSRPSYDELFAESQRLRQKVEELEQRLEELKRWLIPMLVRQLVSPKERHATFEALLNFEREANEIFLGILEQPAKTLSRFGLTLPELEPDATSLRLLAMEGLVRLGSREAVEVLQKFCDTQNTRLRLNALWALAKLGDPDKHFPLIAEFLDDRNLQVRMEAVEALGEWGNPAAIPLLIPLLGDLRVESGFRMSEHAAKALEKLGAGEIARAFYRVVNEGNLNALEQLRPYRKPVIEALMRALDSYLSEHIENAARALKAWNAVEALPKLRSKLRWAWLNLSDSARQSCEEAFRHLETLSRLPAPASPTQIPLDTLPRPADPNAFSTETLPSPAKAPKDEEQEGWQPK